MLAFISNNKKLKNWSLRRRISFVSAVIVLVAFYTIYLVTKVAYINASKSGVKESLSGQIYALMAEAEDRDAQLSISDVLRNDRLNQLGSGLVAYVLDIDGDLIWRSGSSDSFDVLPDISLNYSLKQLLESKLDGISMFWIGDKIIWEHENGMEGEYLFLVGENQSIMYEQVSIYKKVVATWLWVTTFVLIAVLVFVLNVTLKPLKQAQFQIEQVGKGDIDKIEGEFPKELIPLTSSINKLLESEALQKQRYRDSLGNLAHSLKTPLAIMSTELSKVDNKAMTETLEKQLERINDIVKYQLNRSVVTAGQALARKSKVKPEVLKIVEALKKVHASKVLSIKLNVQEDIYFPGEQGDLMELVGNIADNACKWAKSTVSIDISIIENQLNITVTDDGPGIPEAQRALIVNRGKRLDQLTEGQGLGLSIVMDILKIYHGHLAVDGNSNGGSTFSMIIPI